MSDKIKKIFATIQIIIFLSLLTLISCQSLQVTPEITKKQNSVNDYTKRLNECNDKNLGRL